MSTNDASAAKGIIRIVFAKNPPDAFTTCNTFPTMVPSMECPFPGWLVEVIKILSIMFLKFIMMEKAIKRINDVFKI